MDARVPAVVAVVVTRDPGPWFEETLASLASQRYSELSMLVLVAGGDEDPTARIGRVVPEAFVRRLSDDPGFGAAANEVLGMVEGSTFFLLCHDDCAPEPEAVRLMVEESYRSNAGIVTPKFVRWDDPRVLLHVGMNADKTGAVVERVQSGEIDHGQHDVARDVFVAPAGCQLVRSDLFVALAGFDTGMVAMAEDLDLSWRAQIAGARVVVAPEARVRALKGSAAALRVGPRPTSGQAAPTLQELQRRHELRAMLKCYGWVHLLRVLPQAAVLAVAEVMAGLLVGDVGRARAVGGAWRWNLARMGELRALRREVHRQRAIHDSDVRQMQVRGSARLSTYASRLTHQGFHVAHGHVPSVLEGATTASPATGLDGAPAALTGSVGGPFSEDADFDELDDLGRPSARTPKSRRNLARVLGSRRSRLAAWVVVAVVLLFGARGLVGGRLPLIGQFAPLGSLTGTWHRFVAGWQPAGLGAAAPATTAFALIGAVGTALVGAMGLSQKVLVLGCIPLGAYGIIRLLRPMVSKRARLVAAVLYLALPLPYDDLARGRWDGLVAYAAVPFILGMLARGTRVPPIWAVPGVAPAREVVVLGVVVAIAVSFAPAMAIVVPLSALAIVAGSFVVGEWRGSMRALGVGVGATAIALALCGPWVVGTLARGNGLAVFGLASNPATTPGWGQLLRFDVGPIGGSPIGWFLVVAALLPLFIARRWRLAWAARLWVVAGACWALAEVSSRGWSGSFSPSVYVLLAPAAAAVAAAIGLGVGAFETDLSGYRFGWRQVVTAIGALTAAIGMLPVLAKSFDGRWGTPTAGYAEPLSFVSQDRGHRPFRVLWLGDPGALPLGGWSIEPGLAYATSENATPDAGVLWAPAAPGPSARIAASVSLAMGDRTTELGHLLAGDGVRYVVVAQALAPSFAGQGTVTPFPSPARLVPSLLAQRDLEQLPASDGITIFENRAPVVPLRANRSAGAVSNRPTTGSVLGAGALAGWRSALVGPPEASAFSGPLFRGTAIALYAPADRWKLTVNGDPAPSRPALGFAEQFRVAASGHGRLSYSGTPWQPLGILAEILLWLVAAGVIAGRRWSVDWWGVPLAARIRAMKLDRDGRWRRRGPRRRLAEGVGRGVDEP